MTPKFPNLVDPAPWNGSNQVQILLRAPQSTRIWSWDTDNLANRGDLTSIENLANIGKLGKCVLGNLGESQPTRGKITTHPNAKSAAILVRT